MAANLKARVDRLVQRLEAEVWRRIVAIARVHGLDPEDVGEMASDEVFALIPEGVECLEDLEHLTVAKAERNGN